MKMQNTELRIVPTSTLPSEVILEQINNLKPLRSPVDAYGVFPLIGAPIIMSALDYLERDMDLAELAEKVLEPAALAAKKSQFGYKTGKITAVNCEGENIIMKYEGPYEENLETSPDEPIAILTLGGPRKHFYSPLEKICRGQVIACEIIDGGKVIIYFKLQNGQNDYGALTDTREQVLELFKNPRLSRKVRKRIIQTALAISLLTGIGVGFIERERESCRELRDSLENRDPATLTDPTVQKQIDSCRKNFAMKFPNLDDVRKKP